jgi:N-acetylmuramoyl-L-alanine amidase
VANPKPFGTETWVLGERNTAKNFEVAKRENEVIFLEDNYKENYAGFDPSSPESTIAIGIEQEVYVEQSIILARKIEDAFKQKAKRKSRGLKQESLLVIRNTYMPSVLVELGFLTNTNEGRFLNSSKGQSVMARALKEAILEYKKELEQNVGRNITNVDTDISVVAQKKNSLVFEEVTFKVQIAASSKNLEPQPYNFKGLSDISKDKLGDLYKYYFGSTSDYKEIKEMQRQAIDKGYTSSFIVGFRNGELINVSELLQNASNKYPTP